MLRFVFDHACVGLGRFWYMTVSVRRGGRFQYMTTSVHMRSISIRVVYSTTSVRAKYHFGTSLCRYRYIARELLSFYAEDLQNANAEWMFSLLC